MFCFPNILNAMEVFGLSMYMFICVFIKQRIIIDKCLKNGEGKEGKTCWDIKIKR